MAQALQDHLLTGYRILDLTDELGTFGGRLMADYGAEVIRVEPPTGDPLRREPPFFRDLPHPQHSLPFIAWNTNKKSITLNLQTTDGRCLLNALLPSVDAVLLSGPVDHHLFRVLDYDRLKVGHPGLVLTTASGFGLQGPHASFLSSDMIGQAAGGVVWMSGLTDRPPVVPGGNLSNILTGLYMAVGTMVALRHRQVSHQGQHVDISQQDCVASILAEFGAASYWASEEIPHRYGTHRPDFFPNGLYPCRDGYLMVIVLPTDWDRFAQWVHEVTRNETILADHLRANETRLRPEIRALLNPIIEHFTHHFDSKETLFHEGQKRHFLFAPVNNVSDLLRDPHLQARAFWQPLRQPGLPALTSASSPVQSNVTTPAAPQPAPSIGQHNLEIYGGELGISPYQLAAFKENHVI